MKPWDDSESSKDDYEEEQANMAHIASMEASKSNSDSEVVFSHLTHSKLN